MGLLAGLLLFASNSVFAQIELTVPDVKGAPGGSVIVPVVISEGRSVTAIQFVLTFDAAVLNITNDSSILAGGSLADHSVGSNRDSGKLTVVIFSSSLSNLKPSSGAVVNVVFQVSAGAAMGSSSPIQISGARASDTNGNAVAIATKGGTLTVSNSVTTPTAAANELVFPQIANGSFAGGSFVTTLIFLNPTGVPTSGEARFFKSDGTPLVVSLTNGQTGSTFPFTLSEGGSVFLQTDGTGALSAGYARVVSSGPLGGTILFSQLDAGGQAVTESGVGSSSPGTHFSVPLLYSKDSANTGIAFANLSSDTVEILLTLRDRAGAALGTQKAVLAPGQHLPRFATEYFTSLAGQPDFLGSIESLALTPVSAIALKLQGALLTTFPVVEVK
ncbi:MAG TPA: cohesin domain-containing protein [Acidobacteriota bacterium]|nr:cohesin domain-containing protein [Acidobacteriota bacterium]